MHVRQHVAVTGGGDEQLASLLGRQGFHFLLHDLRRVHRFGDVPSDETPPKGPLERPVNDHVVVLDRAR